MPPLPPYPRTNTLCDLCCTHRSAASARGARGASRGSLRLAYRSVRRVPTVALTSPSGQYARVAVRFLIGVVVLACLVSSCDSGSPHAAAPPTTQRVPTAGTQPTGPIVLSSVAPQKSNCAINLVNDAFTGSFATASAIGWVGNDHGVVTCLGGRFYVQDPFNKAFGFGIYAGTPTTWVDADGYLPAQITSFSRRGVAGRDHRIRRPHRRRRPRVRRRLQPGRGDRTRPACVAVADPFPSAGLVPLASARSRVGPHSSAVHDYVIAVDRFGNSYPWPSDRRVDWRRQLRRALRAHACVLERTAEQDRASERSGPRS